MLAWYTKQEELMMWLILLSPLILVVILSLISFIFLGKINRDVKEDIDTKKESKSK